MTFIDIPWRYLCIKFRTHLIHILLFKSGVLPKYPFYNFVHLTVFDLEIARKRIGKWLERESD